MSDRILIIGGSGSIAFKTFDILNSRGFTVRMAVKDPVAARKKVGSGIRLFEVDLLKPATIKPVFAGVNKVLLLSTPGPDQFQKHENIIDVAQNHMLDAIVRVSAMGVHLNSPISILRQHAESERYLERSGIMYTHIRPNVLMQNLLLFAPIIRKKGEFYAPIDNGEISLIDASDIAEFAACILSSNDHHRRTYEITGPESLSFYEVADRLSKFSTSKIGFTTVDSERFKWWLVRTGITEWLAHDLMQLFDLWRDHTASRITPDFKRITGRNPITLNTFIKNNTRAFGLVSGK